MNALRAIPAGMLAAAAAVLGGASKLAELGARRLAPRADGPEPRHPSFLDTSPDTSAPRSRPYAGGSLYDAEADARTAATSVDDVTTDDLVTAADFAAELEGDDPLLTEDPLLTGDVRGEVAGDTVVSGDALDAMVSEAMDETLEDTADAVLDALEDDTVTPPTAPTDDDTASDVPRRDFSVVTADELATNALDDAVLGDDGEARTYESHIAELADRNVASVVREIQDLSTEELGQLFEYESAHRKRKTVLQAIERATAP